MFIVCGVFGILGLNLCYNQAMAGLTLVVGGRAFEHVSCIRDGAGDLCPQGEDNGEENRLYRNGGIRMCIGERPYWRREQG